MALDFSKMFALRRTKQILLLLGSLLLLFLLSNDVILPWYVNSGGIVEVPAVVGKNFDEAKTMLTSVGLEPVKGESRLDRDHPEEIGRAHV